MAVDHFDIGPRFSTTRHKPMTDDELRKLVTRRVELDKKMEAYMMRRDYAFTTDEIEDEIDKIKTRKELAEVNDILLNYEKGRGLP